jgi:hypothetical protein
MKSNLKFKFFYWLETSVIDFFLFDAWWFPTEILSDFLAPRISKLLHKRVLSPLLGEGISEYQEFITSYSIPKVYYLASTIVTGVLEFDFTAILNNTIGALINPAGFDFLLSFLGWILGKFKT